MSSFPKKSRNDYDSTGCRVVSGGNQETSLLPESECRLVTNSVEEIEDYNGRDAAYLARRSEGHIFTVATSINEYTSICNKLSEWQMKRQRCYQWLEAISMHHPPSDVSPQSAMAAPLPPPPELSQLQPPSPGAAPLFTSTYPASTTVIGSPATPSTSGVNSDSADTLSDFQNITPLENIHLNEWDNTIYKSTRVSAIKQIVTKLVETEGTVWSGNDCLSVQFAKQLELYALSSSDSWDAYRAKTFEVVRHWPRNLVRNSLQPEISRPSTAALHEPVSKFPGPPPPVPTLSASPGSSSTFTPIAHPSAALGSLPFGKDAFLQAMKPIWTEINEKVVPASNSKVLHSVDFMKFRKKLESEMYAEPWDFINDILTAVDNAKMSHKSPSGNVSGLYGYWCEVDDLLETKLTEVVHELAYCCGSRNHYKFIPKSCRCVIKKGCDIRAGQHCYGYEDKYACSCYTLMNMYNQSILNRLNRTTFCVKIYENAPDMNDMIDIAIDQELDDDIAKINK